MATRAEAELARQEYSEYLRKKGAHAIEVRAAGRGAHRTFSVVAYFQTPPPKLRPTLAVTVKGQRVDVGLIAQAAEMFGPG